MSSQNEKLLIELLNAEDTTRVKVRFNDTDAMGVVHFKNYMIYFDDGFVSFMNSLNNQNRIEEWVEKGLVIGVKHVDITYENSAKFGDYVIVNTNIEKIGNKSITFFHQLFREKDMVLLAVVKAVRFILDTRTNQLLEIISFFEDFMKEE